MMLMMTMMIMMMMMILLIRIMMLMMLMMIVTMMVMMIMMMTTTWWHAGKWVQCTLGINIFLENLFLSEWFLLLCLLVITIVNSGYGCAKVRYGIKVICLHLLTLPNFVSLSFLCLSFSFNFSYEFKYTYTLRFGKIR